MIRLIIQRVMVYNYIIVALISVGLVVRGLRLECTGVTWRLDVL